MLDDELVAEAQQPFRKRGHAPVIRLCAAAAACAAAVFGLLLIPKGGADILVMGSDPAAGPVAVDTRQDSGNENEVSIIRAYALEPTDIPVSIAASGRTVITVSAGELYITDDGERVPASSPLKLNGNASLIWSVPLWDGTNEFELTMQSGGSSRILRLSCDQTTQEWTIAESSAQ
ncbi:MAG: hypothetical protein ACI4WS_02200 [Oscillospiraceae bacterium]